MILANDYFHLLIFYYTPSVVSGLVLLHDLSIPVSFSDLQISGNQRKIHLFLVPGSKYFTYNGSEHKCNMI